jgi:ATP-dependent Clp protease adapter protein ClpS
MLFNIPFMFLFCFVFSFSILCILCFYTVSSFVYSCLSPTFVVYRPLPPGGNPTAVNKYHISYSVHARGDAVCGLVTSD